MATPPQSLESLRLQLEGRWECIERSREHYTALTRSLASSLWKRELRGQAELLKQARAREAELTGVLSYMEHRASTEQWPPEHPGLGILQELRARRAKLEALARKRLARPSSREAGSLLELLEQLEALALTPVPRPPEADEPVLVEGRMLAGSIPGRLWLTLERMVWRPWFGEPRQVKLASLAPGDIAPSPGGFVLRTEGRTWRILHSLFRSRELVSLLEVCRQYPHLRHERPQVPDLVTHPVYCHPEEYASDVRWGLGVFGPNGVAFLPVRPPTLVESMERFVGIGVRRPEPSELRRLEALVEQLRLLPADTFNQALLELTRVRGGKLWPSTELHRLGSHGRDLRFLSPGQVLVAPDAGPDGPLPSFLARHPPRGEATVSDKAPGRWWLRHYKEKVGIAAGLALMYLVPRPFLASAPDIPDPTSPFNPSFLVSSVSAYIAGQLLFSWFSVRYAKAKGRPWWLALLLSIACTPAMLVLALLPGKKGEPSKLSG